MSLERVLAALYGPRCASCGRHRTRNPSKTCSKCLARAGQVCTACLGLGARGLEGCAPCDGTGLRWRA